MNIRLSFFFIPFIIISITSCENRNPNIDETGKDQLKSLELGHQVENYELEYQDVIYVPIYSDIYIDAQNPKNLLAATLPTILLL